MILEVSTALASSEYKRQGQSVLATTNLFLGKPFFI